MGGDFPLWPFPLNTANEEVRRVAGKDEDLSLHSLPYSPHLAWMFPRCFCLAEIKTESPLSFPDISQTFSNGNIVFILNVSF